jgi:hypothetical protein
MGFWGTLGKIGKAAVGFVPGVGPALSAGIGLAGDIAGGVIGSRAANNAANQQIAASKEAQNTINDLAGQSRTTLSDVLGRQRGDAGGVLDRQRSLMDPYAAQGPAALSALQGNAFDEWQGGDFKAPDVTQDPGYQFRLAEGQKALERGQSAQGILGGGAALKGLTRYAQDYASNEYGKAYDRAKSEYDTRYNQFQDRSTQRWNRLSDLLGVGMGAARNIAGYEGDYGRNVIGAEGDYGQGVTGVNNVASGRLSDLITGAGNSRSAGTLGAADAWGKAIPGIATGIRDIVKRRPDPAKQPIGGTFMQQLRARQRQLQPAY